MKTSFRAQRLVAISILAPVANAAACSRDDEMETSLTPVPFTETD